MNVSDNHFCLVWECASSAEDAAAILEITPMAARVRACRLRKQGRSLKKFPPVRASFPKRRLGQDDDAPGLRTDGRPNHKPKADYCPGVELSEDGFTELEFDEALAAINDPRTPLTNRQYLDELTSEIYRRAAAIRDARPARATVEDRRQPVGVMVIPNSEVFDTRR